MTGYIRYSNSGHHIDWKPTNDMLPENHGPDNYTYTGPDAPHIAATALVNVSGTGVGSATISNDSYPEIDTETAAAVRDEFRRLVHEAPGEVVGTHITIPDRSDPPRPTDTEHKPIYEP